MQQKRKLPRKRGYDYTSAGWYFITTNIKNRELKVSEIVEGEVVLNQIGEIIKNRWEWLKDQYPYVQLLDYVIMPDHFHGLIKISTVGNGRDRSVRIAMEESIKPLPELIGAFKSTASKLIHQAGYPDFCWKKSFYDRIVRDNDELERIQIYIRNNPAASAR